MADANLPEPPVQSDAPLIEAAAPKPRRSRAKRKDDTKTRRRRRGDNDQSMSLKMAVGFEKDPNYAYRWINEGVDGQRLRDKTVADDWDIVSDDGEPSNDAGSSVRRAVGGTNGAPIYSYLCRKPKELHEEDTRAKQKRNDDLMNAVKGGKAPVQRGQGLTEADHVHGDGVRAKGRL